MTKHTEGLLIAGKYSSVVGMPIVGQLGTVICNMATMPVEHPHHKEINEVAQANANRLTSCWNALAGIDDPEAFMLDMKLWRKLQLHFKEDEPTFMAAAASIELDEAIMEHLKGGE